MADISKVKNPDGNTYNVKDSTARDHIANKNNPHAVTKAQIGLGNVDNTSDANKSVKYASTSGSANAVAWDKISGKPSAYTPSTHTHNSIEAIQLTSEDLNDYMGNSVRFLYAGGGNTVKNKPNGVEAFGVYCYRVAQYYYVQELTEVYGDKYLRYYNGTTSNWSAWRRNVDSTNVASYKVNNAANADKINGYTINANVPAGAKFTDTTYSNATTSKPGLMSSSDKAKLDGIATGAEKNVITGVKGSSESSYRTGNVNITKANIGLSNVDNTADANKSVKSATSATKDSSGQQINTTYIKELSALGRTITATKGNGSKSIFNIAGDDLYLFYRGVAVGDLNEITTTGIYYVMSGGLANTGPSNIDITYCYLIVIGFAALKQQFILKPDSGMILMRSYLGQHTVISEDDTLLDENSDPILDEKGNVLTGTFKTPSAIAKNSSSVWSRWHKINGIGV